MMEPIEPDATRNRTKDFLVRSIFVLAFVIIFSFGAWGGSIAVKNLSLWQASVSAEGVESSGGLVAGMWNTVAGNLSAAVIELSSRFIQNAGNGNERENNDAPSPSAPHTNDEVGTQTAFSPEDRGGASETEETPQNENAPAGALAAGEQTEVTVPLSDVPVAEDGQGTPDLAVSVIAVGIIEPTQNKFIEQSTITPEDRGAVFFHVRNIGTGTVADGWIFSATLPTAPAHVFTSGPQQSLAPGDRIEFTLGFDRVSPDTNGSAVVTITVDPDNTFAEATKDNNAANAVIAVASSQ